MYINLYGINNIIVILFNFMRDILLETNKGKLLFELD